MMRDYDLETQIMNDIIKQKPVLDVIMRGWNDDCAAPALAKAVHNLTRLVLATRNVVDDMYIAMENEH